MLRRVKRLLLIAALLGLILLSPRHPAAAQADCPGVLPGTMDVRPHGLPVAVHHPLTITFSGPDYGSVVSGSATIEIDGPTGHVSLQATDQAATFAIPAVGHYTISAHWKQMAPCADPYALPVDNSAPAVPFDAVAEQRPSAIYHKIVHSSVNSFPRAGGPPVTHTQLILRTGPDCPVGTVANHELLTLTLYYARGGATPTHASPHVATRYFCPTTTVASVGPPGRQKRKGPGYEAIGGGGLATMAVANPTDMRALFELRSGGTLLATLSARFRHKAGGREVLSFG